MFNFGCSLEHSCKGRMMQKAPGAFQTEACTCILENECGLNRGWVDRRSITTCASCVLCFYSLQHTDIMRFPEVVTWESYGNGLCAQFSKSCGKALCTCIVPDIVAILSLHGFHDHMHITMWGCALHGYISYPMGLSIAPSYI